MMIEKRRFSRVKFGARGTVSHLGASIEGSVDNLSLNGMLLLTQQTLPEGARVKVEITLDDDADPLVLQITGFVVRAAPVGLAVQFDMDPMDLEALTVLKQIIGYNTGDPEGVMNEFYSYLDRRKAK
jgi:PilZ domain